MRLRGWGSAVGSADVMGVARRACVRACVLGHWDRRARSGRAHRKCSVDVKRSRRRMRVQSCHVSPHACSWHLCLYIRV